MEIPEEKQASLFGTQTLTYLIMVELEKALRAERGGPHLRAGCVSGVVPERGADSHQ